MADYIIYNDCFAYLASRSGLQAKIAAIELIIENNISLIGTQIIGQSGSTNMYELDDGQVRIKVSYTSTKEIVDTNTALEKMQQMYVNRLNGRRVVLRDASTFKGGYGYGGCGC